jgi:hypothetical protein
LIELQKRLVKFVESEWNRDYAYTARDIATLMECDTRSARYFLLKLVDDGRLGQIKCWGKIWYVMRDQIYIFRRFDFIRIL